MRTAKDRAILIVLALGFLLTVLEVRYLHLGAVREHPVAWVPTLASGVGLAAALVGLASGAAARWIGGLAFASVVAAGLVGFYVHTELKADAFTPLFTPQPVVAQAKESDEGESDDFASFEKSAEREGGRRPTLAPLSLSGLGIVGLLVVAWKGERREVEPSKGAPTDP